MCRCNLAGNDTNNYARGAFARDLHATFAQAAVKEFRLGDLAMIKS